MPRRGENIYKRKDGRWEGRYIADRKPDGGALYRSVYGTTYADVRQKLAVSWKTKKYAATVNLPKSAMPG